MGRRKRVPGLNLESQLAKRLKAGKTIKGLRGYVNVSDKYNDGQPIFVACKVLSLVTGDDDELKINVEVVSGRGTLNILPPDWLDTLPQVEDWYAKQRQIEKAAAEFKTLQGIYYSAQRRVALADYINERMTKDQQKQFYANLIEEYNANALTSNHVSKGQLAELAKIAVLVVNNIPPNTIDDHDYRFR